LKRGWTKSWQCVRNPIPLFVIFAAGMFAAAGSGTAQIVRKPKRANELALAGLRPGRDTFADAQKRLDALLTSAKPDGQGPRTWQEACTGRRLAVEVDDSGVIQNVDILSGPSAPNCKETQDPQHARLWTTGRGLRLGDPREHVLAIYGQPGSSGPSVKDGRELELLYYAFDWAGSDVPQVMEISCDRATGHVVEILLAFPSL
jgi:hypothetical protein